MLTIIFTALITMLVTSGVFIYKMCKCGIYVPFILAENKIEYNLGLDFSLTDSELAVFNKAVAFQCKVTGAKVNE